MRCQEHDIYTLIAQEQLYVDVHSIPLSVPQGVHIFSDEETAQGMERNLLRNIHLSWATRVLSSFRLGLESSGMDGR